MADRTYSPGPYHSNHRYYQGQYDSQHDPPMGLEASQPSQQMPFLDSPSPAFGTSGQFFEGFQGNAQSQTNTYESNSLNPTQLVYAPPLPSSSRGSAAFSYSHPPYTPSGHGGHVEPQQFTPSGTPSAASVPALAHIGAHRLTPSGTPYGASGPTHGHVGFYREAERRLPDPGSEDAPSAVIKTKNKKKKGKNVDQSISGSAKSAVTLDRATVKILLEQPELRRLLQGLVHKAVDAGFLTLQDRVNAMVTDQCGKLMVEYSGVVSAFKSRVLSKKASEPFRPSDDGFQYLRINEVELDSFFSQLDEFQKHCNGRLETMATELAAIRAAPVRTAATHNDDELSDDAVESPSKPVKKKAKSKRWPAIKLVKPKHNLKRLVAAWAGLSVARNAPVKIYHERIPENPAAHPVHPTNYASNGLEHQVLVEVDGTQRPLFKKLRFDFRYNYDMAPNQLICDRIAGHMAQNPEEYDLPQDFKAADVLLHVIRPVFKNWRIQFKKISNQTQAQKSAEKQQMRYNSRLVSKANHRHDRNHALMSTNGSARSDDRNSAGIYGTEYQSGEETDWEEDPETMVMVKILRRSMPSYRSAELTRHLRSLDRGRTIFYKTVDTASLYDLPPRRPLRPGVRRFALAQTWVNANPDRLPGDMRDNKGPFTSEPRIARGSQLFGQDPVPSSSAVVMMPTLGILTRSAATPSDAIGPAVAAGSVGRLEVPQVSSTRIMPQASTAGPSRLMASASSLTLRGVGRATDLHYGVEGDDGELDDDEDDDDDDDEDEDEEGDDDDDDDGDEDD